ncbi:MAG: gamma-glutamylcyclotransferase [Thiobacillus sp.]|nr:gamma-glutamylcyclotransferase [Thiobacillus sp.]
MPTVFYLAYGSNLHPLRLTARVPSARIVSVVEMPGYLLAFHKRSVDGSGKCLIYSEQGQHHKMHGVLYEFDVREKDALDKAEGKGNGYCEQLLQLQLDGKTYLPYVYVAQSTHIDPALVPYDWYKELVIAGARYHGFPADYIASIAAIPSKPDLNAKRRRENEDLLLQIGQA